ncbi:MAG TPA: LuxR family transcriptional regulator [Casimicrobiaceae bacterium]|nr:LuxR family transcriptional regulator [Casimicrobiaceae bacterium]
MPAPAKSQQQWIDGAVGVHLGALRHAAAANQAMDAPMLDITRALGFDSFLYAVCTGEARTRTWTTISTEWRALYEERRYMEVDPRFTHTRHRAAPCMWDSATTRREWQVQEFLRDAARFGIRSGVAVSFHDADHARIVLALDSVVTPVSARRLDSIERRLGDVMLLATSLHDLLGAKAADSPTRPARGALSTREKECLRLAARGMTSADIGSKLGITARTANFHFSNLIGKLGVINRHEAIARAVLSGLI